MIRVFVLYENEPDPDRFSAHAALCRKVEGGEFRHGRVFGGPFGDPPYRYYSEWEFEDMDAFKKAARTPDFAATGEDARSMGIPFHVHFLELR